jgi:hypothetical protein
MLNDRSVSPVSSERTNSRLNRQALSSLDRTLREGSVNIPLGGAPSRLALTPRAHGGPPARALLALHGGGKCAARGASTPVLDSRGDPVPIKRCTDLAKAKALVTQGRFPERLQGHTAVRPEPTAIPIQEPLKELGVLGTQFWGLSYYSAAPCPAAAMSATAIYSSLIRWADWSAAFA